MTRRKIRIFVAIVTAAAALTAVLVPVASAALVQRTSPIETAVTTQAPTTDTARVNDGRFGTSVEGKRKIKAANCANMRTLYDAAMDEAAYWQYRKSQAQSAEAWGYYNSQYNKAIDSAAQSWSTLVAWGCV